MSVSEPPLYQPIAGQDGKTVMQWALFFSQLFTGDLGSAWIPAFNGLTSSGGAPTISGRVYELNKALVLFRATIVPASGGNTSATAGTTNINNLPFTMAADGIVFAVGNKSGTGSGHCEKASGLIWTPAWTTVAEQITLLGIVEAS